MEEIFFVVRGFPRLWLGALLPIFLGAYYIFVLDASSSSKSIVAVLLLLSLVMLLALPAYWLWALLLQIAVGIYIAFYLAWKRQ